LVSASAGLRPGDPVRVAFTKWDGGAHWSAGCVWLGEDEHGRWVGWPAGTVWRRPGASFTSHGRQVALFPRDRGFAATFYERVADYQWRVYVDVTTVPELAAGGVITAVDLDLDVIERFDGSCFVDDEDEFEVHRVAYGYPDWLVASAEAECWQLVGELEARAAHFAEPVAENWRNFLTAPPSRPR
jgi:sugar lactone lactonase YvrE